MGKEFWEKKEAERKVEKAHVVVNAAKLEQKDMEEKFGKGSPQEMKARMKVSQSQVAMAEIKAAYRAYGDEAKDPQALAKVSKADAAKVAKSPIEDMGKAAKEAADKVTDEKSMKELDNFKKKAEEDVKKVKEEAAKEVEKAKEEEKKQVEMQRRRPKRQKRVPRRSWK